MFSLVNQDAVLSNVNPRAELNGDEKVPACDLKLELDSSNDVLSEFHATLKSSLYEREERASKQGKLIDEPGHMPKLRFPKLGTLKWDESYTGVQLTVHYGMGGKSDLVLEDCAVNHFQFECHEGGSVHLTFRVQCHPNEKQFGKLCVLSGATLQVSLDTTSASANVANLPRKGNGKSHPDEEHAST